MDLRRDQKDPGDDARARPDREFELEQDSFKLRLRKNAGPQSHGAGTRSLRHPPPIAAAGRTREPPPPPELTEAGGDGARGIVKSPIVGTFYRARAGREAVRRGGQKGQKGQVLCIIEAMKLMNEINAECDGEVVKVYVENGQAVQYGERLFAIKRSALKMFKKILIANRLARSRCASSACRELDIKTVAVYSEADENSLHVRFADEDVCIGPPGAPRVT